MRSLRLNYHLSVCLAVYSPKERFSHRTDGCPQPDHNHTITLSFSLFPFLCCHSLTSCAVAIAMVLWLFGLKHSCKRNMDKKRWKGSEISHSPRITCHHHYCTLCHQGLTVMISAPSSSIKTDKGQWLEDRPDNQLHSGFKDCRDGQAGSLVFSFYIF